jgi:hypothetical protein
MAVEDHQYAFSEEEERKRGRTGEGMALQHARAQPAKVRQPQRLHASNLCDHASGDCAAQAFAPCVDSGEVDETRSVHSEDRTVQQSLRGRSRMYADDRP